MVGKALTAHGDRRLVQLTTGVIMGTARIVSLLSGLSLTLSGQTVPLGSAGRQLEDVHVTDRGPHHRVWSKVVWETNQVRGLIARTNSYVELANGLHYTNSASGQLEESNPGFEITADGYAVARRCQHQVVVSPNLNPEDGVVIDLQMPDGQRLRSGVIGLNLFDPKSGRSRQVGMIRDVVGTLVSSNQIVWPDAFEGLRADVRVRNERGEFHQDVLLRERLSASQLEQLGFDAATVRLEVWSEFQEAPLAAIETVVIRSETNETVRAQMLEPDQVDQRLDFGAMRMDAGSGKAFVEPESGNAVRILKEWKEIGGRRFLIESATYEELAPLLDSLPLKTASVDLESRPGRLLATRTPPTRSRPGASGGERTIQLASAGVNPPVPTVVLDYQLAMSQPDFTFRGDTTYYVDSLVNLSGTTTIEGGTVVKYSPSASARIVLNGPVACRTAAYRPAIFTARDDDTVGEIIFPYSDGNPNGEYFGVAALTLATGVGNSANLTDLRARYLRTAIVSLMPAYAALSCTNSQFVNCQSGVYLNNNNRFNLRNALFANIQTSAIYDSTYYNYTFVDAQHVTFNQVGYLASRYGAYGMVLNVNLTNCVVASVSQLSAPGQSSVAWYGDHNGFFPSTGLVFGSNARTTDSNPFYAPVGSGAHYLAESLFRGYGTSDIDPDLAVALMLRTTQPPQVALSPITTATIWTPIAPRDTSSNPDLGYHYDPLDYLVGGMTLSAPLTLSGGVAIGIHGPYSFLSGTLRSTGTPLHRNQVALYSAVQEHSVVSWANACATYLLYAWNPDTRFGFTDFSLAGSAGLCSSSTANSLEMRDCGLHAARLTVTGGNGSTTLGFTNNLIERCDFVLLGCAGPYFATFYNNLFLNNGNLGLGHACSGSILQNIMVRNNLFVRGSFTYGNGGPPQISHNGYYQTTVTSYGANPKHVTTLDFQTGPLGSYYYPTAVNGQNLATLIDAGTGTPVTAGLYHHTVKSVAGSKEGDDPAQAQVVDIGFHYVGVNLSGEPLDSDDDNIPAYLDVDSDNNGILDNDEFQHFGVLGSLQGHVIGKLNQKTSGRNPSTSQGIYMSPTAWPPNDALNPSCWLAGVTGLTSFSPYHDWDGLSQCYWYQGGPTLITPRHAITVDHMSGCFFQANQIVRFVDVNGVQHDVRCLRKQTTASGDISVLVFDQDLPSTVQWAKVLPTTVTTKLSPSWGQASNPAGRLPAIGCNQLKHAYITDIWLLSYGATTKLSSWFPSWHASCYPNCGFCAPNCEQIPGDSGSPLYLLINNEMVLVGAWDSCCFSTWLAPYETQVNSVIADLDLWVSQNVPSVPNPITGYTVTVANLSSFRDLR